MRATTTVTVNGPIVEGTADRIVNDHLHNITELVAEEGIKLVRTHLDSKLRRPTGRYLRSLRVVTDTRGTAFTDGGVIYGPWLEGVANRNRRSRFKGYAAFRRAAQQLDGDVERVAAPETRRMIDRLA